MRPQVLDRGLTAFRIGDPAGAYPLFDATRSTINPGRWNDAAHPVVYAAQRYSTALLEMLVHGSGALPPNQHYVEIAIPAGASYEVFQPAAHPGWDLANGKVSRAFGCAWQAEGRSLILIAPSVVARSAARALRKRLAGLDPAAAARAADHAADLPDGEVVALYRAIGSELDADALALALKRAGRRLCLPVVLERDAPMVFRAWSPGEPLELDAAGCPAPLPLAEVVEPDLIVTPLLAFDAFGGRLGQGGGYYDRTFAARPGAIRIGFAYAGQAVERLALEAHDIRLHGVLTETGYTAFG